LTEKVRCIYKVVIPETTIHVEARTRKEALLKAKELLSTRMKELLNPENWTTVPILVYYPKGGE